MTIEEINKRKIIFKGRLTDLFEDKKAETGHNNKEQAKNIGINPGDLSKYKISSRNTNEKVPDIGISNILKIAKYYDVSIDYLFGYTNYPRSVSPNKSEHERMYSICEYTGLTPAVIEFLHIIKDDDINIAVINHFLENYTLVEKIIDYYKTSLLKIYEESDYFDHKTREYNSADAQEKVSYANLLNELQLSHKAFYEYINAHQFLKLAAAFSLAKDYTSPIEAFTNLVNNYLEMQNDQEYQEELQHTPKLKNLFENPKDFLRYPLELISDLLFNKVPYGKERFLGKITLQEFIDFRNQSHTQTTENTNDEILNDPDYDIDYDPNDPFAVLCGELWGILLNNFSNEEQL